MNILVIRVGNIGDVLMATPFVRKVREVFPQAQVDFVTSPQARAVVARNPYIRNIFIYRKSKNWLGVLRKKLLIGGLGRRCYAVCFVLEEHPQYKEFASQSVGLAGVKVGFSGEGQQWLDRTMPFFYGKHVIENYLDLLGRFFKARMGQDDVLMDFVLPDAPAVNLQRQIRDLGKYAVIHPGTTEYLPYRGWTPEFLAGTIDFLQQQNMQVVLTGQNAHRPLIDAILSQGIRQKTVHCCLDKNFEELSFLIKHAFAVVCSDTGILHMARALAVPVLGLFGPSNPYHTGAIGRGAHRFIRNDFKCGPCNYSPMYRYEDKKNCLDGQPPACMRSISVDQVTRYLKELLAQKS